MGNFKTAYNYQIDESESKLLNRFKTFALTPFFWGTFVFAIFFSVILLTKLFSYFLSDNALFTLNIYDMLFSLIGFGVGFLIEFTIQIRKELLK